MILLIPVIEMIPNSALAAMLIYAGFRLAAPKEFIHTYQIGKEQLAIFLTTIIVTLAGDLLLGIFAGILVKIIFHLVNGVKIQRLFKAKYEIEKNKSVITINIKDAAIFSNLIAFKKVLASLEQNKKIVVDLSHTKLIDHSFMNFIRHFEFEYNENGGTFVVQGIEHHKPLSNHHLATRVLKKK